MVTFNLKEEMKGKDLADKILPAFQELAKGEMTTKKQRMLFWTYKNELPKYLVSSSIKQEIGWGDAGPKVIEKEVSIKFELNPQFPCDTVLRMNYININIPIERTLKGINLECYYRPYLAEIAEVDLNHLDKRTILSAAIDTIYKALYGTVEQEKIREQGTGQVVY